MRLYPLYLAGFVLYGVVVAGMALVDRRAPTGPHSLLVREAFEGERIKDQDIVSTDKAEIVGRYMRRHIAAGQPITPDDVTERRSLALSPTLAVVASYDPAGRAKPLTAGDRVYLCLDGALISQDPFEVDAVACGDKTCSAIIALKEIPKPIQGQGAAKRVTVADLPQGCETK